MIDWNQTVWPMLLVERQTDGDVFLKVLNSDYDNVTTVQVNVHDYFWLDSGGTWYKNKLFRILLIVFWVPLSEYQTQWNPHLGSLWERVDINNKLMEILGNLK
jgi:hypothetical protein